MSKQINKVNLNDDKFNEENKTNQPNGDWWWGQSQTRSDAKTYEQTLQGGKERQEEEAGKSLAGRG